MRLNPFKKEELFVPVNCRILIGSESYGLTMPILDGIAGLKEKEELPFNCLQDTFVVVRPHPRWKGLNDRRYRRALKERNIRGKVDGKTNLDDQVIQCGLFLANSSNTILNALLLGKGIFVCYFKKDPECKYYPNVDDYCGWDDKWVKYIKKNNLPIPIAFSVKQLTAMLRDPMTVYAKTLREVEKKWR